MPLSEISASVLYVICANLNIKQVLILILFNFQYAWKIGGSFDEKKNKKLKEKAKFAERKPRVAERARERQTERNLPQSAAAARLRQLFSDARKNKYTAESKSAHKSTLKNFRQKKTINREKKL